MKPHLAACLLAVISIPGAASETVNFRSRILNESRVLQIAAPAGYEHGAERYPVLYLLDGETHFDYVSGMLRFLADTERIPPMLLVAVSSGTFEQRTRDLTPPSTAEIDNRFLPGNGGAAAFLSFVSSELVPYVEKNYRTRPYRLLVGHSLGGLFAIHAMLEQPGLFNGYIVIDPSLGWNNQSALAQAANFFTKSKELQAELYLTASNESGQAPAATAAFAAMLREKSHGGFRWKYEWMKDQTHASIPLPSIYRGLETIFDQWHLTDPLALYDSGGIDAIHRHFREGGRRCGYDRTTPPFTVSLVVAGLIRTGRLEEASAVLLHDPKAYPPPWNQLDALARAYAAKGDLKQAAHYYTLSLKENPGNEWARKKLAEMGAGP